MKPPTTINCPPLPLPTVQCQDCASRVGDIAALIRAQNCHQPVMRNLSAASAKGTHTYTALRFPNAPPPPKNNNNKQTCVSAPLRQCRVPARSRQRRAISVRLKLSTHAWVCVVDCLIRGCDGGGEGNGRQYQKGFRQKKEGGRWAGKRMTKWKSAHWMRLFWHALTPPPRTLAVCCCLHSR